MTVNLEATAQRIEPLVKSIMGEDWRVLPHSSGGTAEPDGLVISCHRALVAGEPEPASFYLSIPQIEAGITAQGLRVLLTGKSKDVEQPQAEQHPEHPGVKAWRAITLAMAEEIHGHKIANAKAPAFPDGSSLPALAEPPWDPAAPCQQCLALARQSMRITLMHVYNAGFRLTALIPSDAQIIGGMASVTDLERMKGLPWAYKRAYMTMTDLSIVPQPPAKPDAPAQEPGSTDARRGSEGNGHLA